jgi:hypothetical protein
LDAVCRLGKFFICIFDFKEFLLISDVEEKRICVKL